MQTPEEKRIQAHGITVGEMKELGYRQANDPASIATIPGNNAGDKITDRFFKEEFGNYTLPMHERFHYHVATESRMFAPGGAEPVKTSTASVHKLTKEAYEFQKKHGAFNGQIVHILHNPEFEEKNAPLFGTAEAGNGPGPDTGNTGGSGTPLTKEELENSTVDEIKGIFDELGVEAPKGMKKAELIEELLKHNPVKA